MIDGPRTLTQDELDELAAGARLRVLAEAGLLGDPMATRTRAIDEITELVCRELGGSSSRVSIITGEDQRYLGATNLHPQLEEASNCVDLDHSACKYVAVDRAPLVIEDTSQHPATAGSAAIERLVARSYAGVPLVTPDGHSLGALCVLDSGPRAWSDRDLDVLRRLARWVVMEVEYRRQVTKLEAAARMRDDLLAMVVHEVQGPLTSVVGAARLLGAERAGSSTRLEPEPRRRLSRLLVSEGERLARVVEDLQAIQYIDSGELPVRIERFALQPAVVAAVEAVVSGLPHPFEVEFDVPDLEVLGDRGRLEQVLVNLLANATRYGEPPVQVVGTRHGDARLQLRVRDAGPGIPDEFVPHLFDRFARGPGAPRDAPGSGLGLSIVRGFVRSMDGDVWHEPCDAGACLVVELPIAP